MGNSFQLTKRKYLLIMNKHLILYNFLLGTEITPHYKFEIYSSNSNVKYIIYLKFFTSSEDHKRLLLTFENNQKY